MLVAVQALSCGGKTDSPPPATPTPLPATPTPTPTPAPLHWQVARLGVMTMRGVASDGSIHVGVATDGSIYTSPDAATWLREDTATADISFHGVRFLGGQFVAVGERVIATSADGHAWTKRADFDELRDVTYGNGLHLAVGATGQVVTSPDAVAWAASAQLGSPLDAVAFGAGRFVAVGANGVTTSTDGSTWTSPSAPLTGLLRVIWAPGQFVAAGRNGIMTSPNGLAWQIRLAQADVREVASDGARLVAVGWGTSWTSSNGVSWTQHPQPEYEPGVGWPPTSITSGPAGLVGVGHPGTVFTSANGASWVNRTSPASRSLWSVAYDGSRFCAGGEFGVTAWSSDGIGWTSSAKRIAEPFWRAWASVAHVNGRFLAVSPSPGPLTVATSADCETWQVHEVTEMALLDRDGGFVDVAAGSGLVVGVGYQGLPARAPLLATSTDGVAWTPRALPTNEVLGLHAVAYGAGRFVVLGALGDALGSGGTAVFVSEDGVNWTESPDRLGGVWHAGAVHANGIFVAATGELWTSPSGAGWTRREPWHGLVGVTFGQDRFVAVGGGGSVYTSIDGITWIPDAPAVPHILMDAVYAPALRRFVAVGAAEIIYADY